MSLQPVQAKSVKSVTRFRESNLSLLEYANQNRNENFFNDVIIKADDQNISANRMVLSCFSQYFEKMFKSKMKEQYENIIEVKGVDGKSMQILVDYIYTGQIDINCENLKSLLAGADYLYFNDVKEFCFEFLQDHITEENGLEILTLACLYENDKFKNLAYHFIGEHFEGMTKQPGFNELSKNDLVACVSLANQYPTRMNVVCEAILNWIKYDVDARKDDVVGLLKLIDLRCLTTEYLEFVISDSFVQENFFFFKHLNFFLMESVKSFRCFGKETKVLGIGDETNTQKITEIYNLSEKEHCVNYPDLPISVAHCCVLKVNNYIYCIGGISDEENTDAVWRLDLGKTDWEKVPSLNEERSHFKATVLNDNIIVIGGNRHGPVSAEIYVPSINKWFKVDDFGLRTTKLLNCNGLLYALCVSKYTPRKFAQNMTFMRTNVGNMKWEKIASTPAFKSLFAAVSCGRCIYVIGGKNENVSLNSVEKFDPISNCWVYVSSMKRKRHSHSACVLQDKIFVVGGLGKYDVPVKEIECYIPTLDKWIIVGKIEEKFLEPALVVI